MESLDQFGQTPDEVREIARFKIENDDILKGEKILVDFFEDGIILDGFVDTFEKKWRAEEIVAKILGVLRVTNNISIQT